MKRLKLRISDHVQEEITRQVLYIALDSVDNALAWEERVRAAMKGLSEFHGHAIDDEASRCSGIIVHKLVFEKTYLIYYHVDHGAYAVDVVNFRHGARLPHADEP